jgi:uncharacterized protein (TIGR00730 family)
MNYNQQLKGHRYILAHEDEEYLASEACRSERMKLEYDRVEYVLNSHNISSTIVVFGSARLDKTTQDWMDARAFARYVADYSPKGENIIVTGGGPGIMEAANMGATHDGQVPSIGLNIELPFEQTHNPYSTPELTFNMKYFSTRKFHLVLRCAGVIAFPGGFGTLDEVYEVLTLKQVGILQDIPVVLFNSQFWSQAMPTEYMVEYGTINKQDKELYRLCNTPLGAWNYINEYNNNFNLKKDNKHV